MTPTQIDRLIDLIMARRHAASGSAVFVDPVILRDLITKVLNES